MAKSILLAVEPTNSHILGALEVALRQQAQFTVVRPNQKLL
jgi:hypothetical protein